MKADLPHGQPLPVKVDVESDVPAHAAVVSRLQFYVRGLLQTREHVRVLDVIVHDALKKNSSDESEIPTLIRRMNVERNRLKSSRLVKIEHEVERSQRLIFPTDPIISYKKKKDEMNPLFIDIETDQHVPFVAEIYIPPRILFILEFFAKDPLTPSTNCPSPYRISPPNS